MYEKAKTFAMGGRNAEAIAVCADLRARFEHDDDEDVLHWFGEMLSGLAVSQPDRARAMGARARQRIGRDFGMAQTAQKYLAVYRELLAS